MYFIVSIIKILKKIQICNSVVYVVKMVVLYYNDFNIKNKVEEMKDYEICYYNDKNVGDDEKHTHSYYEMYFFPEENASVFVEDRIYKLWQGDIVILPPGISHKIILYEQSESHSYFAFRISSEYYEKLLQMSNDYAYMMQFIRETAQYIYHNTQMEFWDIQSTIFHLLEEIHGSQYGKETKIFIGICDLFLLLNRMVYKQNHPQEIKQDQNLYGNIRKYIDDNLEKELSLEYLSGKFLISKYHIAHVFKANTGISIHQYIMKKRLIVCKEAILNNHSISKEYQMFGFKDYSSFYRAFKKEFGISPKEYRDLHIQLDNHKEV